ncbi:MAG: ABC transporter permease [Clostridia bacterium]|jgi:ribose transport system permease protein|nr:ABC transporter permease [Clostridia bacterium]
MNKALSYIKENTWIWALIGSTILWLAMGISSGQLGFSSLISNANTAAFLAIMAFGQMLVVTSGRGAIDLSIPGVLTLMAFISMSIINGKNSMIVPAFIAVIAICAAIGFINSLLVIYLQIPAIIATMAMNYILTTAALLINKHFSIFTVAPVLKAFLKGKIFGIYFSIILAILLGVFCWFLLRKTSYGKSLLALGQNKNAASLAGVKTARVEMVTYILCSVLTGIAGILVSARVGSAVLGMGDTYTMDTVASIVIGGTLISGGRANVPGTLVGCLFLGLISAAMQVIGCSVGAQNIAKGALIILVLMLGTFQKKSAK